MHLIVIGMRGAGKSNLARRLSVMTKRPVLSSDLLIEYDAGKRIPDIVAEEGWPAFRDREHAVVKKIAALDGAIVDCGGGVIVDLDEDGNEVYSERKMSLLKQTGTVLWLRGDIDTLVARVAAKADRPNLHESRSAAEIMHRRLPFYERAADRVLDIDGFNRLENADRAFAMFAGDMWDETPR